MSDPAPDSPSRFLSPADIRALAAELGVTPTKKLGQNFVIDANTVRRIVALADVQPGERVLEVGPGLGSLTLGLLNAGADVTAVEIDGRLAQRLPRTITELGGPGARERLQVVHEDALRVLELDPAPQHLVANLPYNISVPVLLHLLATAPSIRSGVVMVQAEVGERMAATPGTKAYGSPSVKAAWYGTWRVAATVSRQVFWPVPNVDSVLVAFVRHASEPGDEATRKRLFALVDAAFGQRRKMLRQSLSTVFGTSAAASAACELAGIDPTQRGEQLTIERFVALATSATTALG